MFVYSNINEIVSFKIIAMQLCYDYMNQKKKKSAPARTCYIWNTDQNLYLSRQRISFLFKALLCIQNPNVVMIENV